MRDVTTTDAIVALLREFMQYDPGITFGQLIFAVAKFAVPESDVLNISDEAFLSALRARCYRNRMRPMVDGTVSIEHLAALDEARDENNTFANEWLCKELGMIKGWLDRGFKLRVADDTCDLYLDSVSAFEKWCQLRFPNIAIGLNDLHGV